MSWLTTKVMGWIGAGLALVVLGLWVTLEIRTNQRDDARSELAAEEKAHEQTILNYRWAQERAAQQEAERLARVEQEQQEITRVAAQNYEARIADLRARAERLRDAPGAAGGTPGNVAVPSVPDAPGGADAATPGAGLPPLGDDLEWRVIATEQAIQLDELIRWVSGQSSVPTN